MTVDVPNPVIVPTAEATTVRMAINTICICPFTSRLG